MLKQLESGFIRTIGTNVNLKTQIKRKTQKDVLIDPSFQGVERLFVLPFKDENGRKSCKQYYLPTVETKAYNIMIDGRNVSIK